LKDIGDVLDIEGVARPPELDPANELWRTANESPR
jgi:hypothetical protein